MSAPLLDSARNDPRQFDHIYSGTEDPWGYRTSWYEQRKRSILLASLPRPRFAAAFEPGCANGETSAGLAERCDRLLACDFHPQALALARNRLLAFEHVTLETRRIPDQWPKLETFDLIVLNEIGYYLSAEALADVARRVSDSLRDDGCLVSCHWRHPVSDAPLTTSQVESILGQGFSHVPLATHREADFSLLVWARDADSVASAEGLT